MTFICDLICIKCHANIAAAVIDYIVLLHITYSYMCSYIAEAITFIVMNCF